ncbi:MAG: KpsF/GutQ family sugar-phosphate isomerase [Caulobacteraceae bacterium]
MTGSAPDSAVASALRTLRAETAGLEALGKALSDGLGAPFARAVDIMRRTAGRVIVTGMGKSGHVGGKIAATLASTGTPAFFLHPAEASHGDLGMITTADVVLALSWTGESKELLEVIAYCSRFGVPLIGITSGAESALGAASDPALVLPTAAEACPNQLAPTTSTTMQLAMGDALAVALLEARGFTAADFRNFHPGGKLGARLVTVGDLMQTGDALPKVSQGAALREAIVEMNRCRLGGVAVVDGEGHLVGVFTDGDLLRRLEALDLTAPVAAVMTRNPAAVDPHLLAAEAVRMMNERTHPITLLFVREGERLVGVVHMHDLLRAGVA